MKQLHKTAYHIGNLEATQLAWNVITALPPTNEDKLVWKLLTFCLYKFIYLFISERSHPVVYASKSHYGRSVT